MRVLLFGGTGNVGKQLIRAAQARRLNCEFFIVSRGTGKKGRDNSKFITNFDYSSTNQLHSLFSQINPSWVVNCAVSYGDEASQISVNIKFVERLSLVAKEFNTRLLHLSSIAVLIDEDTLYSLTKKAGEIALSANDLATVLRISAQRRRYSLYWFGIRILKLFPDILLSPLARRFGHLRLTGPCDIEATAGLMANILEGSWVPSSKVTDVYGGNWFYLISSEFPLRLSESDLKKYLEERYNLCRLNLPRVDLFEKLTLF